MTQKLFRGTFRRTAAPRSGWCLVLFDPTSAKENSVRSPFSILRSNEKKASKVCSFERLRAKTKDQKQVRFSSVLTESGTLQLILALPRLLFRVAQIRQGPPKPPLKQSFRTFCTFAGLSDASVDDFAGLLHSPHKRTKGL